MTDKELFGGILVVLLVGLLIYILFKIDEEKKEKERISRRKTIKPDLIQDEKVTIDLVEEKLEKFVPEVRDNLKNGITEKEIQRQLLAYLKSIFQSVTPEHVIESKNGLSIDFDIGSGKVGIEVKLSEQVMKTAEKTRLSGQLREYTTKKYNKKNLIVFIAGFDGDDRNTMIHEVEDMVIEFNCRFVYRSAGEKPIR